MLADLDIWPLTTPLDTYTCYRCGRADVPLTHRCGHHDESDLALTVPPSRTWRVVCVTLTALGLFQAIQGVVEVIQWLTGGA